ncbi:hypothetical protein KCU99_g7523, partial [Aureobasidium melanogenum]
MEVIWIICWGAWGLAYLLPYGIQFFAGFITTHSRKYAELLQAIILPMALFFWALLSRAATPVLCAFDENRPVASTGIFFVEKILIHILTINYRQKQFRVRLQDIERTVYILTLMYQASRDRFPIHCPEFATEDHKIHDSRLVDVAERKTTRQFSTSTTGSRLSVMADNMKKRLAGREVLKHDSARSVVLHALETTTASEALAIRLYRSFTAAGSQGEISESDVALVLGPTRSQEAQDIFHALDKDENGDVSLEEMTSLVTQTSNDKHSMRRGLYDIGQAIQSLDNLLCLIVLLAAGLIYAAFFSQAIASKVTALWGGIAATSFAISGTVQEFLGSCIFLFVKHPYDVGDHVVINNTNMAVEQISLMYSVFRQIDSGSIVQISNMVNNAAWIRNISRSKPMKESYDFAISAKTKFPAIENLKTELQAFVLAPENRRDFQSAIDVELISVGNLKELKLRVRICQKSNFANDSLYSRRRTKFMCALLSALRKHDIKSPGGGGPPPVGSWENPGYSVAVTDAEAQEARAKYEAEEEAKRLKKLNEHALEPNPKRNPDKKPDEFAAAASVVTHLGKWRKAATQPEDDVFSSAYNSVTAQEQSYDSAVQSTAIEQHSDYPEDYGANTEEDDTLHLILPNAVSSPAAQDVLLGALIDERSRLESLRLKLPPQDPIFAPTTIPPSDPVHRDVLEQRKHQWLLKERERYFSDPGAPIVPTPSMPKHKPDVDAVVQVVEEAGYDDFGFAIVRLDYTDEEEWERWKGIFDTVQDQSVDECLGGAKIKDKLLTMFVEDEELQGTGWHGAVSYFSDLRANDQVPEGLDTPIILVADEISITSLLHPTPDVKPWIWALDLSHDWVIGDVPSVAVTPTDVYPGYFRVALEAVIPELWPLLKGTEISGLELWGGDDSVWEGP